MRSLFLTLFAVTTALVTPADRAAAQDFREVLEASCHYADAAHLFHRSVARSRRASDYSERLADRLAHAADDLHDAILSNARPRRIAVLYDEVYELHGRVSELLGSRCATPDRVVLSFWGPLDGSFERLVCAIEGCAPVCPLISNRRVVVQQPVRVTSVTSPSGLGFNGGFGPSFMPGFGTGIRHEAGVRGPGRDQGRDRFQRDRSNELRRAPDDFRSAMVRRLISRLID